MAWPSIFGPRGRHLGEAWTAVTRTAPPAGLFGEFSAWLEGTTQWRLKVVALIAIAINIPLFLAFDLSGSYGVGDFTPAEARALMLWRTAFILAAGTYLAVASAVESAAARRLVAKAYIAALALLGAVLSGYAQPVIHDGAAFALLLALIASVLHTPDRFRWLVYGAALLVFAVLAAVHKSAPVVAGMMVNAVSIVVAAVAIELIAYSQLVSIFVNTKALEAERAKVERLLHNTLPAAIAGRLQGGEDTIAEGYPEATVMFADLVGFTELSGQVAPERLVALLNTVFGRFDDLAERHGIEKIKTIGDAYMVACGLPANNQNHLAATADYALAMLEELAAINREFGHALQLRIGMHSGYVVAGVIGHRKFSYDVWGDNVNIASRMESSGVPGRIQVTESVALRLADRYRLVERGVIEIKGKGPQRTYFLDGRLGAAG